MTIFACLAFFLLFFFQKDGARFSTGRQRGSLNAGTLRVPPEIRIPGSQFYDKI
jgi:hypothetical protein